MTASPETAVRDLLLEKAIDLVITVPCKYVAPLITTIEEEPRIDVLYPAREEEGLGIAAGAFVGGRRPLLLIQNSGLGNLINAYASLHVYYQIPLAMLVSHRGDRFERVAAQVPMGERTPGLLALMGLDPVRLERSPDDLDRLARGLDAFTKHDKSCAFLAARSFWMADP